MKNIFPPGTRRKHELVERFVFTRDTHRWIFRGGLFKLRRDLDYPTQTVGHFARIIERDYVLTKRTSFVALINRRRKTVLPRFRRKICAFLYYFQRSLSIAFTVYIP